MNKVHDLISFCGFNSELKYAFGYTDIEVITCVEKLKYTSI